MERAPKYNEGGECYEAAPDGKPKKPKKSCSKTYKSGSGGGGTTGRDVVLGAMAAGLAGLGLKKMLDSQKYGGQVKSKKRRR